VKKIKKCAARSHAPKNASSVVATQLCHSNECQNRACIFTKKMHTRSSDKYKVVWQSHCTMRFWK